MIIFFHFRERHASHFFSRCHYAGYFAIAFASPTPPMPRHTPARPLSFSLLLYLSAALR
jgi:hypothetical protein